MWALGCGMVAAWGQVPLPVAPQSKTHVIEVRPGGTTAFSRTTERVPVSGAKEVEVSVRARLVKADRAPEHDGRLVLQVLSRFQDPTLRDGFPAPVDELNIRLVLSSVADAYGESRECSISHTGAAAFTFTAGLDEQNFVAFEAAKDERDFRFSLNKYLCRALAAPFRCDDAFGRVSEVKLPSVMSRWKVGVLSSIELDSKGAPAKVEASDIAITSSEKDFDYATCAAVAPSNGMCCVGHKTTEWHCGGTPEGPGWHQVSGDCYHRETGGSCSE